MKIAIFGAGAIGCYVGGHWALASPDVKLTLVGRAHTFDGFAKGGLRVDDLAVDLKTVRLRSDPAELFHADVIVLAMKSTGLSRAQQEIAKYAAPQTPVVSLLNGVSAARDLKAAFPDRDIIAGMVPFNVVWQGTGQLHRSSVGQITVCRTDITQHLAHLVKDSAVPLTLSENVMAVQYGKLLLNLVNPINALSGLPLHAMLCQSGFRKIYSDVVSEALGVLDAAGVHWEKVGPFSPRIARHLLRSPDWFFNNTLLRIQKIDPKTLTSMAADVRAGRPTEISQINGEIVHIAQSVGRLAPLNAGLVRLIQQAHAGTAAPAFSASDLKRQLSL